MWRMWKAAVLPLLFMLTGCLGFRALEYRIQFADNFKTGQITITFEDIQSDNLILPEEIANADTAEHKRILKKRAGDFEDVIDMCESDEQLLDAMEQGIYLKKRYIFECNNKLHGRWEGIFSELRFDEGDSLKILKDEIYLTMKLGSDTERVETDGRLIRNDNRMKITWPKTQQNIYWKLIIKEADDSSSLINEFRVWRDNK